MKEQSSKHGLKYATSKSVCHICGYIAAYSFDLKVHILRRHMNEKPIKCTKCSLGFVTKTEVTRHMRNQHTEELWYQCQVCEERFKSNAMKRIHEDREHEIEIYCKLCNNVFYKTSDLRYHRRVVHGPEKISEHAFSCDICFRVFYSQEHLQNHKVRHKSHKCIICNLVLATSNDLISHKRFEHNVHPVKRGRSSFKFRKMEDNNTFKCIICDYSSVKRSDFEEHLRAKHKYNAEKNAIFTMKDKITFECNICHSCFYRRKDFFSHVESDHPELMDKVCPYVCKFCSKKFTAPLNLRNHMLIHKNDRKFQCDLCDYSSVRKQDLNKHKRVIHSINQIECRYCDEKFNDEKSLKNHVNKHLGKKDFKCKICELEFYSKYAFVSHMNVHKNNDADPRHLCSSCGYDKK